MAMVILAKPDIISDTAIKRNVHPKVLFLGFTHFMEKDDGVAQRMYDSWRRHGTIETKMLDYLLDNFWRKGVLHETCDPGSSNS